MRNGTRYDCISKDQCICFFKCSFFWHAVCHDLHVNNAYTPDQIIKPSSDSKCLLNCWPHPLSSSFVCHLQRSLGFFYPICIHYCRQFEVLNSYATNCQSQSNCDHLSCMHTGHHIPLFFVSLWMPTPARTHSISELKSLVMKLTFLA